MNNLIVYNLIVLISISVIEISADSDNNVEKITKSQAIIGGEPVSIKTLPFIVQILTWTYLSCGGSIISENFILTAAHCTFNLDKSSVSVRLGTDKRRGRGNIMAVSNMFTHPSYNSTTDDYDFCLLKLAWSIPNFPNQKMAAIPLQPANMEVYPGNVAFVAGWGLMNEKAKRETNRLQMVGVPIIPESDCQKYLVNISIITDRVICAGLPKGGADACEGDSGGPLIYNGKLIGVVSWGEGCARPNLPGVYGKVSSVRNWISMVASV